MVELNLRQFSLPIVSSENCQALCDSGVRRLASIQSLSPQDFAIETRLKVTGQYPLSLNFTPSLNYLIVIGGGHNSRDRGYFNEHEFLKSAINQTCWLLVSDSDTYQNYGLQETDRPALLQLYHELIQAYWIDQMLNTVDQTTSLNAVSAIADSLLQELQVSPSILIHGNDSNHAFYFEIEKQNPSTQGLTSQGSKAPDTQHVNVHLYNTGKGVFLHQKSLIRSDARILGRKLKFETKKSFYNIELTQQKLAQLIANMQRSSPSDRSFTMPVYGYYALLTKWRKSVDTAHVSTNRVLQSMQNYRDCQQKTLLSVIKNRLDPRVYCGFKTSLLERALSESTEPETLAKKTYLPARFQKSHSQLYQIACSRLEAKISRNRARLDKLSTVSAQSG